MRLRSQFDAPVPTIVLAEGEFGQTGGKTANGVVMHSTLFDAQVVIDSQTAGSTAREVLEKPAAPEIPIVDSLDAALEIAPEAEAFVIGVAPAGGDLPESWVDTIEGAVRTGCDIVSGLHTFLGDDPKWQSLADEHDVRLFDVRKPPEREQLRVSDGSRDGVDADVVLTMGTDCAVGKRTTTFELYKAATDRELDAAWIATGQTGIMIGADYGVVIDRVPADFSAGVVERMIVESAEQADLIFVEGQASLSHRAYSGVTLSILHGSWPDSVVLADEPNRGPRTHFGQFSVEGVQHERRLIESLAETEVVALSTWGDPEEQSTQYGLPTANVFHDGGPEQLLDAVLASLDEMDGSPDGQEVTDA